jgi:hypothetical protein
VWIHVPSAYVQDTEESNWDSVQLSQELEPSATWSGKSKPAKSWERVLKTESLTTLLSGLTLEPLMRQHGVDRYISSLEDSLANPILLQDYEKESQIPENSQEKYSVLQTNLGDQLSFLRMCQESKSSGSTTSDPSFKEWDTELRKSSLLRQKQAHHIRGSDYSSWPTNSKRDYKQSMGTTQFKNGRFIRTSNTTGTEYGATLDGAAQNWHTLLEDDSSNVSPSDKRRDSLAKQTNRWEQFPTPSVRDYKGFDGAQKENPSRPREVYVSILPDQVIHEDGSMCSPRCRRLSPLFAEWLMGLPQGYLDSSEPVEMELFQQWQQELGSYLVSVS